MTYGARESNPKEGTGLLLLVVGLMALSAGWAYAGGLLQPLAILIGVASIGSSFAILKMAKDQV